VQRLELSNKVTQPACRILGSRPRRAVPESARFGLLSHVERALEFASDVRELFQFDRANLRARPGSEECADDPKQVT
jgi:hypothetical protein